MMKLMDTTGNRRFERTEFHVKGFVTCDGKQCPIDIVNISMKGVLAMTDGKSVPEIGKTYPLRISLPHSDISIMTGSTLVHSENGHFGFRFDSIDAEGMIHLRRLLELNISSDDEISRELAFLVE